MTKSRANPNSSKRADAATAGHAGVPEALRVAAYFDFAAHPFAHQALFRRAGVRTVVDALDQIGPYCQAWLKEKCGGQRTKNERVVQNTWPNARCSGAFTVACAPDAVFAPDRIIGGAAPGRIRVSAGACVRGGDFDVSGGDIFIGPSARIWDAWISGPAIIGDGTLIRPGALLRGDVILGRNDVIRGELKNVVVMDDAQFPHPSYLGDSICGYGSHFGNQATAANVNIFARRDTIKVMLDGVRVDLGRRKVGIIMGDYAQVGCNAVADPGTFLRPHTVVYALTRINSGVYGPREVLKNKPMEHGVIERAPLR